jgi:hypothetical protein
MSESKIFMNIEGYEPIEMGETQEAIIDSSPITDIENAIDKISNQGTSFNIPSSKPLENFMKLINNSEYSIEVESCLTQEDFDYLCMHPFIYYVVYKADKKLRHLIGHKKKRIRKKNTKRIFKKWNKERDSY